MAGSVLIVDDNVALAENLGEILTLHNLDVIVESDPIRALARAHELELSLVVLDIYMPRMNGLTLHRHLLELHPNANFVLMTARAVPAEAAQSICAGARVLEKPIDLDEFVGLARESNAPLLRAARESSAPLLRTARESSAPLLRAARESSAPLLRAARESSGPRLVSTHESSAPLLRAVRESSAPLAAARLGHGRSFAPSLLDKRRD